MISFVFQWIAFIIILLIGGYLTDAFIHRGEKKQWEKARKDTVPRIRNAIAYVGPVLLICLILGLIGLAF